MSLRDQLEAAKDAEAVAKAEGPGAASRGPVADDVRLARLEAEVGSLRGQVRLARMIGLVALAIGLGLIVRSVLLPLFGGS